MTIFAKNNSMKYEFISTLKVLAILYERCASRLLNAVFDENRVITSEYSSYWDATSYVLDETKVSRIDKIQVVTLFLTLGGIVTFDGHQYSGVNWENLWDSMASHNYISPKDLNILKRDWRFSGKIDILQ